MGVIRKSARVEGRVIASETSVLGILDEEAQVSERAAIRLTRDAIAGAAPVGPGRHRKHLRDSFGYSVRRTPFGYAAQITRDADAWYGRIVENGRRPGVSRNGRRYPGARANPFVDRTAHVAEAEAEVILAAGAERAGRRIGELVVAVR